MSECLKVKLSVRRRTFTSNCLRWKEWNWENISPSFRERSSGIEISNRKDEITWEFDCHLWEISGVRSGVCKKWRKENSETNWWCKIRSNTVKTIRSWLTSRGFWEESGWEYGKGVASDLRNIELDLRRN